jgi:hypothetical protein
MRCNQIEKIIPQLLRREVNSETRLDVINHLRQCNQCRTIYYHYQNMYYSIDRNIVLPAEEIDINSFNESVRQRIGLTKPLRKRNRFHYAIYATAAVLLIFAIIYSFSKGLLTYSPASFHSQSISLKEHLEYEDWQILNSILQDPQIMKKYLDEKIPIALLREKLMNLHNSGIHSITYITPTVSNGHKKIEIPVDVLLTALNRYRQNTYASVRDLLML